MIIIPTPKELGFFLHLTFHISHFTKRKFTFPLSQFPSYKNEICDKNSITKIPVLMMNFDITDFDI